MTVVEGAPCSTGDGWSEWLARWETLVVPASSAGYLIDGAAGGRVCIGSVP